MPFFTGFLKIRNPMTTQKIPPSDSTLQSRLDALKKRIMEKRAESIQLFEQVLEQYKAQVVSNDVPSHVQSQLEFMQQVLELEASQSLDYEKLEELCAKLAIDDVLHALQTLSVEENKKAAITSKKFQEDLKKHVAMRYADINKTLPAQWQHAVKAKDMVNVLHQPNYAAQTQKFGGPTGMLEQALKLAENFANMLDNISKDQFSATTTPPVQQEVAAKGR